MLCALCSVICVYWLLLCCYYSWKSCLHRSHCVLRFAWCCVRMRLSSACIFVCDTLRLTLRRFRLKKNVVLFRINRTLNVALRIALDWDFAMPIRSSVAFRLFRKWRRHSLRQMLRLKNHQTASLTLSRCVATPSYHEKNSQGDITASPVNHVTKLQIMFIKCFIPSFLIDVDPSILFPSPLPTIF